MWQAWGMKVNGYEIKPKADLSGADLAGADLAGARLGRANLEGANLEGANLSAAKLKNAKLEGANLASAILPLADLEEAVLDGACLTDAVLCGANLSFAWLHRANLTRADLRYALLQTTRLTEANLTGAVLTGSVFQPTFDNFVIADETTVWPAGFDPEVAWARGAVIQTSEVLPPQEKEVVEFAEEEIVHDEAAEMYLEIINEENEARQAGTFDDDPGGSPVLAESFC
mgnify:FL=1